MYGRLPLGRFPQRLRTIPNAPTVLWYEGNLRHIDFEHTRWCALVGSRNPSAYGKAVVYRFAFELAQQGVVIVSGLARGIDAQAHQGALDAHGVTVAVLGTAIDHIYPREHTALARNIIASGGLLVSEVAPRSRVVASSFSRRNRIIAGMAHAVIIIEGANHSGTLTTVRYALSQGKEIGAVPGDINRPTSFVPNMLVQQGAATITSTQDIIELMA